MNPLSVYARASYTKKVRVGDPIYLLGGRDSKLLNLKEGGV